VRIYRDLPGLCGKKEKEDVGKEEGLYRRGERKMLR
jgi:hypothetical protein